MNTSALINGRRGERLQAEKFLGAGRHSGRSGNAARMSSVFGGGVAVGWTRFCSGCGLRAAGTYFPLRRDIRRRAKGFAAYETRRLADSDAVGKNFRPACAF